MKKIIILLSVIECLMVIPSFAQPVSPPPIVWQKTFGGSGDDAFNSIVPLEDGGFVLGGYSSSNIDGHNGDYDYWVVRIDALGNQVWGKSFGGTGSESLVAIQRTPDGGFALGGYSNSGPSGNRTSPHLGGSWDFWLVRLNAIGDILWDHSYGTGNGGVMECMRQTSDGGFIFGGYAPNTGYGARVVRTDAFGNQLWDNFYGTGPVTSVVETPDHGFLLGRLDFSVVKIDANGNQLWQQSYAAGGSALRSLSLTSDGGFLLGGSCGAAPGGNKTSPSYGGGDFWIVRLDSAGAKLWDQSYGGDGNDELSSIGSTSDGGFLLKGSTTSGISGNKTTGNFGGYSDWWVVRVDSNGNKLWDDTYGSSGEDSGRVVLETTDGGILLAGKSYSEPGGNKTTPHFGIGDGWVVKLGGGNIIQPPPACGPASQTFSWAKRAGGSGGDGGTSIAVDAAGNSFVTGTFNTSADFGGITVTTGGGQIAFLAKYDPAGNTVWVKQGVGGRGVMLDPSGNIYLTGESAGTAKCNSDGQVIWAKGSGGYSIALDPAGNIYVSNGATTKLDNDGNELWVSGIGGTASVASDPEGNAIIAGKDAGFGNFFVAKFDAGGNEIWRRFAQSRTYTAVVATDALGNIYVSGDFYGDANFDGVTLSCAGANDFFVGKYDSSGTLLWINRGGGGGMDSGNALVTDSAGDLYLSGYFYGTADVNGTVISANGYGGVVAKYNSSSGGLLWVKSGGDGDGVGNATSIGLDAAGNIYGTGEFVGSITFDGITLVCEGSKDILVTKLSSSSGDTENPVITVLGDNPATVACHTSYTDAGATATDNCAGNLTGSIATSSTVNVNAVGSYLVSYTVSDGNGNTTTATRTVNVVDTTTPMIMVLGANPATVECHTSYTDAGATATDNCADNLTGSIATSSTVNVNAVGNYLVSYTVSDGNGNTTTATRAVNVVDTTKPVITVSGANPATVECHTSYTDAGATATDNCAGNLTGSITTSSTVNVNAVGSYLVSYTVSDGNGNTTTATRTVNVVNQTPLISSLTGPDPAAVGSSSIISVTFTDVDVHQTHTCTFEWDDGQTTVLQVAAGLGQVTASHTYATTGVYSVNVTISDGCNSTSQTLQFIVIYDPNGGFVTGGGWINSLAGSYPANPALTGKASFGFVSKYKKGVSVPTGQTEFQFEMANFNFHSEAYEWLVVAGAKAQYRGTGTVNGSGNYGFLLTATDGNINGGGGVDQFRIKIWDKNHGNGVVYDNRLGVSDDIDKAAPQNISGGSIVIHK